MSRRPDKVNIPMVVAMILLILTIISVYLSGGLYARYSASAGASDSARVAKFQVSGSAGDNVTINCRSTETGTYTITLGNQSEVAVEYEMEVVFQEAVPEDKLEVTLDEEAGIWSEDGTTLTFSHVGTLGPGAGDRTHHLSFQVLDWSYVTEDASGEEIQKTLDFTVNITAEQID